MDEEREIRDFIQGVVAICALVSTLIAAGLIMRVIFVPSWDHFGDALMFVFLSGLTNWYKEKLSS